MTEGNKLPSRLDNPIDVVLLRATASALPAFRATGHTPNMLTTYSFLAGLGAVAALWCGNAPAFAAAYTTSYVFDCIDGQFARRYGMTSRFGDLYDHITDMLVNLLLIAVVAWKYRHAVGVLDVSAMVVVIALVQVHMGCQQRYRTAATDEETLDTLEELCPGRAAMQWTRYCGCGTLALAVVLYGVFLVRGERKTTP